MALGYDDSIFIYIENFKKSEFKSFIKNISYQELYDELERRNKEFFQPYYVSSDKDDDGREFSIQKEEYVNGDIEYVKYGLQLFSETIKVRRIKNGLLIGFIGIDFAFMLTSFLVLFTKKYQNQVFATSFHGTTYQAYHNITLLSKGYTLVNETLFTETTVDYFTESFEDYNMVYGKSEEEKLRYKRLKREVYELSNIDRGIILSPIDCANLIKEHFKVSNEVKLVSYFNRIKKIGEMNVDLNLNDLIYFITNKYPYEYYFGGRFKDSKKEFLHRLKKRLKSYSIG
jgi:hypothetical protein